MLIAARFIRVFLTDFAMKFKNKNEAVSVLEAFGISVSQEEEVLYPLGAEHDDEVHVSIDYLIEEHGFGIRYI
jgi:hypothetical protein